MSKLAVKGDGQNELALFVGMNVKTVNYIIVAGLSQYIYKVISYVHICHWKGGGEYTVVSKWVTSSPLALILSQI